MTFHNANFLDFNKSTRSRVFCWDAKSCKGSTLMQSLVGTQLQTLICSEGTDPSNRLGPCNKPWATPFLEPLMVLVALGPCFIPCLFLDIIYASFRHPALPCRTPSVDHGDYIATATTHFYSSTNTYALQHFALSTTSMITALFCLGSLQILYLQFCIM